VDLKVIAKHALRRRFQIVVLPFAHRGDEPCNSQGGQEQGDRQSDKYHAHELA
jgi:hypothetical protein